MAPPYIWTTPQGFSSTIIGSSSVFYMDVVPGTNVKYKRTEPIYCIPKERLTHICDYIRIEIMKAAGQIKEID